MSRLHTKSLERSMELSKTWSGEVIDKTIVEIRLSSKPTSMLLPDSVARRFSRTEVKVRAPFNARRSYMSSAF